MRVSALVVTCALVLGVASVSHAETTEADALFNQGRELLERGLFADACAKFKKSNELAPAPATLLNFGYCQEQLGRMKTAMDTYVAAQALAEKAGDPKKVAFAKERLVAATARATKLVILVAPPIPDDLVVQRNGTAVTKAEYGRSIPVDPDEIVVTASAPGRRPWRTVVIARGDGASVTVFVPPLEEPETSVSGGIETKRLVAIGLGIVGAGTLGAGFALGLGAHSRYRDTLSQCDDAGCDPHAVDVQDSARAQGNVATVLVGVGLVTLGAGVVLWLTTKKEPSFAVLPMGIRGRF